MPGKSYPSPLGQLAFSRSTSLKWNHTEADHALLHTQHSLLWRAMAPAGIRFFLGTTELISDVSGRIEKLTEIAALSPTPGTAVEASRLSVGSQELAETATWRSMLAVPRSHRRNPGLGALRLRARHDFNSMNLGKSLPLSEPPFSHLRCGTIMPASQSHSEH